MDYNHEKFINLIIIAKGKRSLSKYARAADISESYLSRLVNGKIKSPPKPAFIKKLADVAHNGITYEDLMAAAGYLPNDTVLLSKDELSPKLKEIGIEYIEIASYMKDNMISPKDAKKYLNTAKYLSDNKIPPEDVKKIVEIISKYAKKS